MLPFRSGRGRNAAAGTLFALAILVLSALAADPSATPEKKERRRSSLTNIPLPIGQEAKGLVLPDIDPDGHLRARFEAGTAKRLDLDRVEMRDLRMVTFTPQNQRDLLIEMPLSTLDLNTQIIQSHTRTTVSRLDFTISGDTMEFDTVGRTGKLVGNVKMVLKNQRPSAAATGQ